MWSCLVQSKKAQSSPTKMT